MKKRLFAFIVGLVISVGLPVVGISEEGQGSSGGHGDGQGCGDVFGDLIHIKRDAVTGQPIFQERPIAFNEFIYCPIPVRADGSEIGFLYVDSCDPAEPDAVVEVDYFGRLNAGRTKERNQRMHFNEVISNIKAAGRVKQDPSGRLMLGFDCIEETSACATWSTIDSPMENMALYTRLMKYGHIQTHPKEPDLWAHGDPALGTQYHPALDESDWAKFDQRLLHLAPENPELNDLEFYDFEYPEPPPESLDHKDFALAATFLGGAANKNGKITVDLVQYINRFLKITHDTETTLVNEENLLPALIRKGEDGSAIVPAEGEVSEFFVNFSNMEYLRSDWHNETLEVIRPKKPAETAGDWIISERVSLMGWLEFANGEPPDTPPKDIGGFVEAASDSLRSIEFIHNYAIPDDLGWDFK